MCCYSWGCRVGHDRATELNGGEGFLGKGNYVLGPESIRDGDPVKVLQRRFLE